MNANLLLIDGNNLAFRVHWTHQGLSYKGSPVSLLYGFYQSLIFLKKKFPDYIPMVIWDRSSTRRKREANDGVERGIIPSGYKANRNVEEPDEMLISLFEQLEVLREDIDDYIRLQQVSIEGLEADDVIYSYSRLNKGKTIIITSDKDFYQMLDDNVSIYDAMKKETWTKKRFIEEFGVEPWQWVEIGALSGDRGDNIWGVQGIGPKNAIKLIKEYKCVNGVIKGLREKNNKSKKPLPKKEQAILGSIKVIQLAKSLKQMDYHPKALDEYRCSFKDKEKLQEYFKGLGFESLLNDAWRLVV